MSHSITVLKSKLHNATVTHALKDYEGSVALSQDLIDLGKFRLHEQVHLWNITQGTRLITYVMKHEEEGQDNYTTDKGMNGYADTECNEEEGQTILELHGHNLCLFHGKENLTENEFLSDNGEFYCHSIAINGVLIPIYCDRYEIVEINGNHILFVSVAESTWFED